MPFHNVTWMQHQKDKTDAPELCKSAIGTGDYEKQQQ